MKYLATTTEHDSATNKVVCETATFEVEAEDILEALAKMTSTESDLLENRRYSDLESLRITITVERI